MRDRRKHQGPPRRERFETRHDRESPDAPVVIFGIHAVEAALANPVRKIHQLRLTDNAAQRLADALKARRIEPIAADPRDLDRLLGADTVHQGAMIEVDPLPEPDLAAMAARAAERGGPIVVLDQITDPHNVGAILRSAAAFNSAGAIMTRRHSPPLAGTLAKSASGGLEHVPVALVPNLAQAMARLADLGVWRIGLDGEATDALETVRPGGATALVLGAEGKGLRRLTRELTDQLCRITTTGPLASLNVSNAAAIALHVLARRSAAGL